VAVQITSPLKSVAARAGKRGVEMKILAIVLLVLSTVLFSQDILFEDDFNDGNADGWIIIQPEGTYVVNDSLRYDLSYYGSNVVSPSVARGDSAIIYMSVQNYSILVECIPHLPSVALGVGVRFSLGDYGYVCWIWPSYNDIDIWRHDGSGSWISLGSETFSFNWDEAYWIRFECDGGTLRARAWQHPNPEPTEWDITVSDSTYTMGCIALVASGGGSGGPAWGEFDNVVVTSLPNALEHSTWSQIKAMF